LTTTHSNAPPIKPEPVNLAERNALISRQQAPIKALQEAVKPLQSRGKMNRRYASKPPSSAVLQLWVCRGEFPAGVNTRVQYGPREQAARVQVWGVIRSYCATMPKQGANVFESRVAAFNRAPPQPCFTLNDICCLN